MDECCGMKYGCMSGCMTHVEMYNACMMHV